MVSLSSKKEKPYSVLCTGYTSKFESLLTLRSPTRCPTVFFTGQTGDSVLTFQGWSGRILRKIIARLATCTIHDSTLSGSWKTEIAERS